MAYDIHDNALTVYKADDPSVTLAGITDDSIMSLKSVEQISYLGDELVYDTMHVEAMQERTITTSSITYDTQLEEFPYGSLMRLENSGGGIDRTFYVESSQRIGTQVWGYDNISNIGLLDRMIYGGYSFLRNAFGVVLRHIIGDPGELFDYDDTAVYSLLISGWIPYGSKRSALQQLLFATNVHIFWDDANNQIVFDYINHTSAGTIADGCIFDVGKVEYPQLATKITITEHAFFYVEKAGREKEVIFDNTQGYVADNELIKFSVAPVYPASVEATGSLTLTNVTTDSAVVSGKGTLKAFPLFHTTFQLVREANDPNRKEYEVSVTDAYLVSNLNSENVADRLADYWFNRFIVKNDIVASGEKCGKFYTVKDAFGVSRTGFLQRMQKVYSSFIRTACEFLCGVTQDIKGNAFNNTPVMLYYNTNGDPGSQAARTGTWTVPAGVTRIRMVLIGGGTGGSSGVPGSPGSTSGQGGKGGAAGESGAGGNVFIKTIAVNPGDTFSFSLGEGGAGGAALSYATYQSQQHTNAGSVGTDTTFSKGGVTYSSADGARTEVGYDFDYLKAMQAEPGTDMSWGAGGDGGDAGEANDVTSESDKRNGKAGQSVNYSTMNYSGGAGGTGIIKSAPTSFATVNAMTVSQIVSAGVYLRQNGTTSLQTPTTGYAQSMKNYAAGAITYCNVLGWKYDMGIPGGGGGGAAFAGTAGAGGAGQHVAPYPQCLVIDTDNLVQQDTEFTWHEINTTKGGNGGNGANPGMYPKYQFSPTSTTYGYKWALGVGGRGGFGGGGGGGAAASRSGQKNVSWFLAQFAESPTTPTAGSGGNGGKGQDGSDGGIIIFY